MILNFITATALAASTLVILASCQTRTHNESKLLGLSSTDQEAVDKFDRSFFKALLEARTAPGFGEDFVRGMIPTVPADKVMKMPAIVTDPQALLDGGRMIRRHVSGKRRDGTEILFAEDNRVAHMLKAACWKIVTFQILESRIPTGGVSYQCGNLYPEGWYRSGKSKTFAHLMAQKPWLKFENGAYTLTTSRFSETVADQAFTFNPGSDEFLLFRGADAKELEKPRTSSLNPNSSAVSDILFYFSQPFFEKSVGWASSTMVTRAKFSKKTLREMILNKTLFVGIEFEYPEFAFLVSQQPSPWFKNARPYCRTPQAQGVFQWEKHKEIDGTPITPRVCEKIWDGDTSIVKLTPP